MSLREFTIYATNHPLTRRVAHGMSWVLVGTCISQVLTLAAGIVVARWLGSEQYGRFGIIQSTIVAIGVFAGLGLGLTAAKYVSEFIEGSPERAGRIASMCIISSVAAGLLMMAAVLLCARSLAENNLNDAGMCVYLQLASALPLLNAVIGVQSGILAGMEAFRDIALTTIYKGAASVPLLIGGAYFGGLAGAIIALVATAIVGVICNHAAIRKYHFLSYHKMFSERRILWKFSAPAVLSGALVGPVVWLGNMILVKQPDGYAQLGLFTAAYQWRAAVTFLPAILAQTTLPILSQIYGGGDVRRFYKVLLVNITITLSVSTLCALLVMIGKPIIIRAYGKGYEAISGLMILMLVATIISATASVIGQALASAAEMWAGFWLNCLWALAFAVSCILLVPSRGALGLAEAFLTSYSFHALFVTLYSWFTLRGRRASDIQRFIQAA